MIYAITSLAPSAFNAWLALLRVPAVSIKSSGTIQTLSFTSPIRLITSDSLAFSLLLSIIAKSLTPSVFATDLALITPPVSGETTCKSSTLYFPITVSYTHLTLPTTEYV